MLSALEATLLSSAGGEDVLSAPSTTDKVSLNSSFFPLASSLDLPLVLLVSMSLATAEALLFVVFLTAFALALCLDLDTLTGGRLVCLFLVETVIAKEKSSAVVQQASFQVQGLFRGCDCEQKMRCSVASATKWSVTPTTQSAVRFGDSRRNRHQLPVFGTVEHPTDVLFLARGCNRNSLPILATTVCLTSTCRSGR